MRSSRVPPKLCTPRNCSSRSICHWPRRRPINFCSASVLASESKAALFLQHGNTTNSPPHTVAARMNPASMLQSRAATKAVQCLPKARRFSSTPAAAAVSPYRKGGQAQNQPLSKRNVSDTAKRPAQAATAAATQRPIPAPAFNRDDARLRDVQPLQPFRQPEMDHSFVGMTGGQIFHEMMLRHGVKHVCGFSCVT